MYWIDNPHQLQGTPHIPKPGEKPCYHCLGYGYRPRRQDEPSGPKAIRCEYCEGSGLNKN